MSLIIKALKKAQQNQEPPKPPRLQDPLDQHPSRTPHRRPPFLGLLILALVIIIGYAALNYYKNYQIRSIQESTQLTTAPRPKPTQFQVHLPDEQDNRASLPQSTPTEIAEKDQPKKSEHSIASYKTESPRTPSPKPQPTPIPPPPTITFAQPTVEPSPVQKALPVLVKETSRPTQPKPTASSPEPAQWSHIDIQKALETALLHEKKEEIQAAKGKYILVLEHDKDNITALLNLGAIYQKKNEFGKAIDLYKLAIDAEPTYSKAYNNLGLCHTAMEDYNLAIAAYHRALELDNDNADTYNNLGIALKKQGHLEDAAQAYLTAIELNPGLATAYLNLGLALDEAGKTAQAITAYRLFLKKAGDAYQRQQSQVRQRVKQLNRNIQNSP